MADLWIGVAINLMVSCVCGCAVQRLSRQWTRHRIDAASVVVVLVLVGYVVFVWDRPYLARWLPFSNLIVLGNALPFFSATLAGLSWKRLHGRSRTRMAAVLLLVIAGVGGLIRPMLGNTPDCDERWDGHVCLQTTKHTCSAASAATVLHGVGIATTEADMARLCLTHDGTHWMGLYRGLRRKLSTDWRVEFFDTADLQTLREISRHRPAILTVELPRDIPTSWEYRQENGWQPGVSHSVVCFGPDGSDHWLIADPVNGLERWSTSDLLVLWHGSGCRLLKK